MTVNVTYNQSFYDKLDPKKLKEAAKEATTETMQLLEREVKDYSPVRTGALRRSHSYDIQDYGYIIKSQLKAGMPYWIYLEYGTRYIPAYGYVARAIEVTDPAQKIVDKFLVHYHIGGK